MTTDPYYDSSGCLVTPERAAVPTVPAHVAALVVSGWNAGANSIKALDGDIHVVFSMPSTDAGAVVGFRSERPQNTTIELVEHGLYFQAVAGYGVVQVIERGALKAAPVQYTDSDAFEIRRVGPVISYWKGTTHLYVSAVPSFGTKLVNGCLYLSGDTIQ